MFEVSFGAFYCESTLSHKITNSNQSIGKIYKKCTIKSTRFSV